ncbi:MAG: hypothetical protein ABSC34_04265 [Acidimicrobiales bacterium]|jgi:hypothetical protein
MDELIPSYLLKMERAEKHLKDLKIAIAEYASSHPYTVTVGREGKRQVHRLHFTSQLDRRVSLIAADFVYNIRSGLDHLAAELNPPRYRTKTMFPILWEGVWEPEVPGENEQRTRDRAKWLTTTRHMNPEAVAILKTLQPHVFEDLNLDIFFLDAFNRLSNKDRHSHLPLIVSGLRNAFVTCTQADGSTGRLVDDRNGVVKDNASIPVPKGAVNVKIKGTPAVIIRIAEPKGFVEIPSFFEERLETVRRRVVIPLSPFVWVDPKK